MAPETLRERKRARTRQALIDAGVELFEEHGYDSTTVADIAAAADIATRTYFSYFATKEELLFPESDERVAATLAAIEKARPGDDPAEVLLKALRDVGTTGERDDMVERLAALRLRLIRTVPAVRGRALQIQLDAQHTIAEHLHKAFPDRLDAVTAGALVGAFVGAISGALEVLLADSEVQSDPKAMRRQLDRAVQTALDPWIRKSPR